MLGYFQGTSSVYINYIKANTSYIKYMELIARQGMRTNFDIFFFFLCLKKFHV